MSRIHLGMKRPLKQLDKNIAFMKEYLEMVDNEEVPFDKSNWKTIINDVLIQLNNVKNTKLDYEKSDKYE